MKAVAAVCVIGFLTGPLAAQEPTLAELAARQKKGRTGQAKVITEEDLRGGRARASASSTESGSALPGLEAPARAAAAPGTATGTKSEAEQRADQKAEIEGKIKQWNDFIADTHKAMDAAQLELNDLSSLTFGNRRAGLQKVLDEGKQLVAEAQQAIAELEEQARRAGIALSR